MKMNLFDKAKSVGSKPSKKKADKDEKEIVGLKAFASVATVEKAVKALKDTFRYKVELQMVEHFSEAGMKIGARPANFRGVEDDASASLELRARSSASGLDEAQQHFLEEIGISTQVVEDVEETYRINPAYKDDSKLLAKVAKALEKVPGLPVDFIERQESTKKVVVTERSLDEVFSKGLDKERVVSALKIVGTLAIKAKLEDDDARAAFETVLDFIEA